MAEKIKVPTLNLSKNNLTAADTQQSSTSLIQGTTAEASVNLITGSSFYTQRGATEEYIIPGLGNSDKKAKENLNESESNQNLKKKRKKRKNKNKNKKQDDQADPNAEILN